MAHNSGTGTTLASLANATCSTNELCRLYFVEGISGKYPVLDFDVFSRRGKAEVYRRMLIHFLNECQPKSRASKFIHNGLKLFSDQVPSGSGNPGCDHDDGVSMDDIGNNPSPKKGGKSVAKKTKAQKKALASKVKVNVDKTSPVSPTNGFGFKESLQLTLDEPIVDEVTVEDRRCQSRALLKVGCCGVVPGLSVGHDSRRLKEYQQSQASRSRSGVSGYGSVVLSPVITADLQRFKDDLAESAQIEIDSTGCLHDFILCEKGCVLCNHYYDVSDTWPSDKREKVSGSDTFKKIMLLYHLSALSGVPLPPFRSKGEMLGGKYYGFPLLAPGNHDIVDMSNKLGAIKCKGKNCRHNYPWTAFTCCEE